MQYPNGHVLHDGKLQIADFGAFVLNRWQSGNTCTT